MLWLWCRPAATSPIRPLAWEPPYAKGVTLKRQKNNNNNNNNNKFRTFSLPPKEMPYPWQPLFYFIFFLVFFVVVVVVVVTISWATPAAYGGSQARG